VKTFVGHKRVVGARRQFSRMISAILLYTKIFQAQIDLNTKRNVPIISQLQILVGCKLLFYLFNNNQRKFKVKDTIQVKILKCSEFHGVVTQLLEE